MILSRRRTFKQKKFAVHFELFPLAFVDCSSNPVVCRRFISLMSLFQRHVARRNLPYQGPILLCFVLFCFIALTLLLQNDSANVSVILIFDEILMSSHRSLEIIDILIRLSRFVTVFSLILDQTK